MSQVNEPYKIAKQTKKKGKGSSKLESSWYFVFIYFSTPPTSFPWLPLSLRSTLPPFSLRKKQAFNQIRITSCNKTHILISNRRKRVPKAGKTARDSPYHLIIRSSTRTPRYITITSMERTSLRPIQSDSGTSNPISHILAGGTFVTMTLLPLFFKTYFSNSA